MLTVVGNRPQFVKAAAVSGPLRGVAREVLVHTGQHYDAELSQVFFDELGLPRPDHRLDLGGGTNTAQTARMLGALEPLLAAERPALVLVYGDTNSTLAGALAGAQAGIPVAHVEAGMRSYDRTMPEELNRVLTDHASDLLLCSAEAPAAILREERVGRDDRGRGRRDGRRRAAARTARGGPHGGARRPGGGAGPVPPRDRASRRQRRRPAAARPARGPAGGAAGPRRAPAPPAHARAARGRRAGSRAST